MTSHPRARDDGNGRDAQAVGTALRTALLVAPEPAVAARHIEAMVLEQAFHAEAAPSAVRAQPVQYPQTVRRSFVVICAAVTSLMLVLGAADALPAPIQRVVHDVARVFGVNLPATSQAAASATPAALIEHRIAASPPRADTQVHRGNPTTAGPVAAPAVGDRRAKAKKPRARVTDDSPGAAAAAHPKPAHGNADAAKAKPAKAAAADPKQAAHKAAKAHPVAKGAAAGATKVKAKAPNPPAAKAPKAPKARKAPKPAK